MSETAPVLTSTSPNFTLKPHRIQPASVLCLHPTPHTSSPPASLLSPTTTAQTRKKNLLTLISSKPSQTRLSILGRWPSNLIPSRSNPLCLRLLKTASGDDLLHLPREREATYPPHPASRSMMPCPFQEPTLRLAQPRHEWFGSSET